VKSVLQNILVFWISLAKIPRYILDKIRQRLFSIFWTGNTDKGGINLVKWENIANPKKYGGWGFKNILLFGKALAAKILWRSLVVPSIWKDIVKEKYLKKK
jgi:hypothetical protein